MRQCTKCKATKDLIVNSTRARASGKIYKHYLCRSCKNASRRAYTHTPNGKVSVYKANINYLAKKLGYKVTKVTKK